MSSGSPRWIDNHCHIDSEENLAGLISEAAHAGVIEVICVGVDVPRSLACIETAAAHDAVWATAGVHPHDASGGIEGLREAVASGRERGVLVAVGECGLDHHYEHSPPAVQRDVFSAQIALANELDLALVIHTREAWEETFDILDSQGWPRRTVFHCFTGGVHEAAEVLRRGALLSVSGIVTFPSAVGLRDAVAAAPLASLMVETDAPYLAPVPHRGKRNRPALVTVVGAEVARLQQRPIEDVASATLRNTEDFYQLRDARARRG